ARMRALAAGSDRWLRCAPAVILPHSKVCWNSLRSVRSKCMCLCPGKSLAEYMADFQALAAAAVFAHGYFARVLQRHRPGTVATGAGDFSSGWYGEGRDRPWPANGRHGPFGSGYAAGAGCGAVDRAVDLDQSLAAGNRRAPAGAITAAGGHTADD